MGQARRRKQNGTYPEFTSGPSPYSLDATYERRMKVEVWHPTADDLPLMHIPEDKRPRLRKRLAPWLRKLVHVGYEHSIGIQGGHCWEVAQALMFAAKGDPGVVLVEGVWNRKWQLEEGDREPAPHTWVMVDGFQVDLIREFYDWRSGDDDWVYEPLVEYSYAELTKLFGDGPDDEGYCAEGFDVTSIRAWDDGRITEKMLPEHLRSKHAPSVTASIYGRPKGDYNPKNKAFVIAFKAWKKSEGHDRWNKDFTEFNAEREEAIDRIVFKPAIDRMLERYAPMLTRQGDAS